MSRILAMNELYKKIINIHGIICEFGVRWGQNMALFTIFKGIYEPYNYNRTIIGFDTFEGFVNCTDKDKFSTNGQYNVSNNYQDYLNNILTYHRENNPIQHCSNNITIKGDASIKIYEYLEENPHTIFSFIYFDIYKPTIDCLNAIKPLYCKRCYYWF